MLRTRRTWLLSAAALAVFAATAGRAANVTISTSGTAFDPPNRSIEVGDSVTWTNTGRGFHNVVSETAGFRCASGCDGAGGSGAPSSALWSFTRIFDTPGEFVYFCEVHGSPGGGMRGVISVQGGGGGEPSHGALRFAAANYNVDEGAGARTITVQRVDGADGGVSVHYATSAGSAKAPSDYAATSGTLSWADGDGAPKTFSIPIAGDTARESKETFSVALSAPAGGAALGSPASALVTIADDDGGSVNPAGALTFKAANYLVAEDAGTRVITVQRLGGTAGAVSVEYTTSASSAAAGVDYGPTSGVLHWADHDGSDKTFIVPILEDGLFEGDEAFELLLTHATGGAVWGPLSSAVATITDNDASPGQSVCHPDDDTLCLAGERFQVETNWSTTNPPATGKGRGVALTSDTGYFWFFDAANVEVVTKVLDACPLNARFWTFAGGLTNVEVVLTVLDTQTGQTRTYVNPADTAFRPIQDTSAFATCQ